MANCIDGSGVPGNGRGLASVGLVSSTSSSFLAQLLLERVVCELQTYLVVVQEARYGGPRAYLLHQFERVLPLDISQGNMLKD